MKRRIVTAVLLSSLLALSPAVWAAAGGETVPRRMETVFFIALPFASLYSSLLTLGAAAIIQKGEVRFTVGYQAAAAGLAAFAAGWIAWKDSKEISSFTIPGTSAETPDTPR